MLAVTILFDFCIFPEKKKNIQCYIVEKSILEIEPSVASYEMTSKTTVLTVRVTVRMKVEAWEVGAACTDKEVRQVERLRY